MLFKIPVQAQQIIQTLENKGYEAYLVGGCVRDFLLDLVPKDYDICTSARPEMVVDLFEKTIPTGVKHGTVTVLMDQTPYEVTTFRVDAGYSDHRRPNAVLFSTSLVEDLQRRDFTINAIAYHPDKGVIDPFHGSQDIQQRVIRAVGEPMERFREDALRMLRAVRFQARFGFTLDTNTQYAIVKLADTIEYVSFERILSELEGILTSPFPDAIQVLYETGILQRVFSMPLPPHSSFIVLKQIPEKSPTRWTALFYLLQFNNEQVATVCNKLRMSTALQQEILQIFSLLQQPLPINEFLLRYKLSVFGLERFNDALLIRAVLQDNNAALTTIVNSLLKIRQEKHCIQKSNLSINGVDLMSLGFIEGRILGSILDILFLCVLQNPNLNEKDILIQMATEMRRNLSWR